MSPSVRDAPAAAYDDTRLWRDRRFRTFWVGQGVCDLGDRVCELALPLMAVTMLQASSFQVSLLTAAVWAPNLLSMFTGAWVDQRARKQAILVLGDLGQAAALLTLPLAYWLGALTFTQLGVVALAAGVAGTFSQTAYQPFFVTLVHRDRFIEANSLLSTTRSISFLVGPALGGLLVQVLTAPLAILVDAASFVVSAVMTGRVHVRETVVIRRSHEALLARAGEGLRYVWRHPYLSASLRCSATLNFFSFMVAALAILYASRGLELSAGTIGLAYGVGAVGGLAGAVVAPRASRRLGVGRTVALGSVLFSAPFAVLALADGTALEKATVLAAVEMVSSAGIMLFDINLNAVQAAVTEDGLRSRASGAYSSVNYGIRPLGALAGGACSTIIGVQATLLVAAVGGSLACMWLLGTPIISIRSLDDLVPVTGTADATGECQP